MSHAALHSARPARAAHTAHADPVGTTQRWAVAVLVVATAWLLARGWGDIVAVRSGSLAPVAVLRHLAPALLVGWCTGLATSAALAREDAAGARAAGLVAGAVGTVAGAVLLALTGLR